MSATKSATKKSAKASTKTSSRKAAGAKTAGAKRGTKSAGSSNSRKSTKTLGAKRSTRSRTADRSRINVSEAYELRDWSKQLGVTPTQLKKLVGEHGASVAAVRKAITSSKRRSRTADRSRVNVHQPYELRYWTKALNVTGQRLKELVKEHGPSSAGIRSALGMS
jgi:hypothetical protein